MSGPASKPVPERSPGAVHAAQMKAAWRLSARDMADRVSTTGRAVPRVPRKDDEPALVIRVPLD